MKRLKTVIVIFLSLIALTSCEKSFDVKSVHFGKEGGTKVIESSSYVLSITDYNGNAGISSVDENLNVIHAEKDWLKATLDVNSGTITITAQKNDSGKSRKLYLNGMSADFASSIPVIQEK